MLEGTISFWHPTKNYGTIITHRGGGTSLRYHIDFIHLVYCEPEVPSIGCPVRFEASHVPPKYPGDKPYAVNVEIFEKEE
jgi:hypothetical protein